MSRPLRRLARSRAGHRCEYCLFHERDLPLWPFHLDHIRAKQHGGRNTLENVAWACQRCSLFKGTNLSTVDPDSGVVVRLFNPRQDAWSDHFAALSNRITGLTPIGRATVWLLQMNSDQRVQLRAELRAAGRWPDISGS
jgi:HNH endonuclease